MKYSAEYLESLPTISTGHFDNLKIDTGVKRVWLSRMTIEDGMPYNNGIIVERLIDGIWKTIAEYQG
ncbi:MAG TPA: hypothetical protein VGA67_01170 [Candidatus Dojkabacteria bacterium]